MCRGWRGSDRELSLGGGGREEDASVDDDAGDSGELTDRSHSSFRCV